MSNEVFLLNPDGSYVIENDSEEPTLSELRAELVYRKISSLKGRKSLTITLFDVLNNENSFEFDFNQNNEIQLDDDETQEQMENTIKDLMAIGIFNGGGITLCQELKDIVKVGKKTTHMKCLYGISLGEEQYYFVSEERMEKYYKNDKIGREFVFGQIFEDE